MPGDRERRGGAPAGAPRWVTEELIAETIRVWQPYHQTPLTTEDALAMLLHVGRLLLPKRRTQEEENR